MEFNNQQKAILHTLLYSDIFDFPLTEEELWQGLISDKITDKKILKKNLDYLCRKKIISSENGYYCIHGKEENIKQRQKRKKITVQKFKIAKSIAGYLAYIPTVYFIGLTGRLSHFDADMDDDIDILIITKRNTLWVTRLLVLAALELLNVRRSPNDPDPKNKICPNLIIDESAVAWPSKKHDLYTAHEITHIIPLFIRKNLYQKFMDKNKWISRFYPNFSGAQSNDLLPEKPKTYLTLKTISFIATLPFFEKLFSEFQKLYMRKKITNEIILSNFLAFHPHDVREEILNNFKAKIKKFNLVNS